MAYFDFSGTVEVSVTYTEASIETARIRPLSYGITHEVTGKDTLKFTLAEPRNLSIEVNGDIFDNLQLFAGPIETSRPGADDPDVIYFGPGVHSPSGGTVAVPSGKTVYLAGGAVLNARVAFARVDNARLIGRGVITGAPGGGCTVEYSKNIEIDGVTMLNPDGYAVTVGEAERVTIRNIRAFSSKGWGDGIDVFCSKDVLIDGVFMRNSDDCIAIYNHGGTTTGTPATSSCATPPCGRTWHTRSTSAPTATRTTPRRSRTSRSRTSTSWTTASHR